MSLTFGPSHAWGVGPTPDRSLYLKYWGFQNIQTHLDLPSSTKAKLYEQVPPDMYLPPQQILSPPPQLTKKISETRSKFFPSPPSNLFLKRRMSFEPPATLFLSNDGARRLPEEMELAAGDVEGVTLGASFSATEDDFGSEDEMDTPHEPPAHPPQLFPGPSQSGYSGSIGFTPVHEVSRKDIGVPAALKAAVDAMNQNYRCGKKQCALSVMELTPPVLHRQQAFSFQEEVMVMCPVCKERDRVIVYY